MLPPDPHVLGVAQELWFLLSKTKIKKVTFVLVTISNDSEMNSGNKIPTLTNPHTTTPIATRRY